MMLVAQSKKGEIFGNFSNMWAVGDHTSRIFLIFLDEMVKNTGLYLLIQERNTRSAMRRRA